jgi:transcription initiation factor TFIID subunit 3
MTPHNLHFTLLRPPILHILRAAGFQSTRPAVLDALTDLAARYLLLLAHTTAMQCAANNSPVPTLQDVRLAMTEVGLFRPQMNVCEEDWLGEEDMRGLDGFLEWATGDGNREIRRIAGLVGPTGKDAIEAVAAATETPPEDFLASKPSLNPP